MKSTRPITQSIKYPEWHRKPLRLSVSEMEFPEFVITDFFEQFSLLDARLELNRWLSFTLIDTSVHTSDIVYLFGEIEKLLEANFLINQSNHEKIIEKYQIKNAVTSAHGFEYPSWHRHPLKLDMQELNHPKQVLVSFFENFHLPEVRGSLKNAFEMALKMEGIQCNSILEIYEKVEKLIEASWLLHQKDYPINE